MQAEPEAPIGEDDLHALVDGVLDPARAPAVQRYLAARPDEAARVRAFAAQRDALRAALAFKEAEPIPPRLRLTNLRAARRRALLARARVAAAAAALLLAGAGLGWGVRGTLEAGVAPAGPAKPVPQRLLAGAPQHEEATARDADLGSWLARRLAEPLLPPDLAGFGFALDAASVLQGPDGAVVTLRYLDQAGAAVSVARRPAHDPAERELRCTDQPGGLVTYTWSNGRHLHAVTAALPRERLRPIALAIERGLREPPPDSLIAGSLRRPCEGALG